MSRRQLNQTDNSVSSSLREDAAASAHLFETLPLDTANDPKHILNRLLSVKSVISTASTFAERQQKAQNNDALQVFRHIGVGSCGTAFEQTGTDYVIKKQNSEALSVLQDFKMHVLVRDTFAKYPLLEIKLPKPKVFISTTDKACGMPIEIGLQVNNLE